jgi:hypothetical protein
MVVAGSAETSKPLSNPSVEQVPPPARRGCPMGARSSKTTARETGAVSPPAPVFLLSYRLKAFHRPRFASKPYALQAWRPIGRGPSHDLAALREFDPAYVRVHPLSQSSPTELSSQGPRSAMN